MSEKGTDTQEQLTGGDEQKALVILGHVSGVHGLQGWIKVYSDTQPRENITTYGTLLLNEGQGWKSWKISSGRRQGKNVVLKLAGCSDRNQAELLVGAKIAIKREQLPEIDEPGKYYWSELLGLAVETTEGVELGEVERLFDTGANDVLVVKGERERLIPYLWQQVVVEVDLDSNRMVVDWDPEF